MKLKSPSRSELTATPKTPTFPWSICGFPLNSPLRMASSSSYSRSHLQKSMMQKIAGWSRWTGTIRVFRNVWLLSLPWGCSWLYMCHGMTIWTRIWSPSRRRKTLIQSFQFFITRSVMMTSFHPLLFDGSFWKNRLSFFFLPFLTSLYNIIALCVYRHGLFKTLPIILSWHGCHELKT